MNLNALDWFKAQGLLVKLVQVLTPLTDRESAPFYFLDKRFFFAPMHTPPGDLKQSVQLLSALQLMQKEVEEFVGRVSAEEPPSEEPIPVSSQARRLIQQVQKAIGKLVQSDQLKEPKIEPLREVFTKLKPNLNKLVEAVAIQQRESREENRKAVPSAFRKPIPTSTPSTHRYLPPIFEDKVKRGGVPSPLKSKKEEKEENSKATSPESTKSLPPSTRKLLPPGVESEVKRGGEAYSIIEPKQLPERQIFQKPSEPAVNPFILNPKTSRIEKKKKKSKKDRDSDFSEEEKT